MQWAQPSLCTEWTNHDVLAHLVVGYAASLASIATTMVRRGGSFNGANTDLARTVAAQRAPADLIDEFVALIAEPAALVEFSPDVCYWATMSYTNSISPTRSVETRRYPPQLSPPSSTRKCAYRTRSCPPPHEPED